MTKVEDIEKAISSLAPKELARLRAWFEAFQADRSDARVEGDAKSGKLDGLAAQAFKDFKAGRVRNL